MNGEVSSSETLLSENSIMEYEMILGLRKTKGINLKEFYDKLNLLLKVES